MDLETQKEGKKSTPKGREAEVTSTVTDQNRAEPPATGDCWLLSFRFVPKYAAAISADLTWRALKHGGAIQPPGTPGTLATGVWQHSDAGC